MTQGRSGSDQSVKRRRKRGQMLSTKLSNTAKVGQTQVVFQEGRQVPRREGKEIKETTFNGTEHVCE